jgi:hypothetical protein
MDPNSTYLLKIKPIGKKKVRKDFSCFSFEMVINLELTNYKDLIEEIVDKYPLGYLKVTHVQYFDDVKKIFPEVQTDQELMSLFEKHSKTKVMNLFISYCSPSEPFESIKEWHNDVQRQPTNSGKQDEHNYLCNPLPENEHVGVDEEIMYLENAPVQATNIGVIEDMD